MNSKKIISRVSFLALLAVLVFAVAPMANASYYKYVAPRVLPPVVKQPSFSQNIVIKSVGQRERNFLIQRVNYGSVSGLLYRLYPSASLYGQPTTLYIGSIVGYGCEGITARIVSINPYNQTVAFVENIFPPSQYGCPI